MGEASRLCGCGVRGEKESGAGWGARWPGGLALAAMLTVSALSAALAQDNRPGRIGIKLIPADVQGTSDLRYLIELVFPGSPAEEAGLRPGDEVMMIAGNPVKEMTPEEVATGLTGEVGTDLQLVVKRMETGSIFPVTVTRIAGEPLLRSVVTALLARDLSPAEYAQLGEEELASDPFLAAAFFIAALELDPDEPTARAGLEAIQSRVEGADSTKTKEAG